MGSPPKIGSWNVKLAYSIGGNVLTPCPYASHAFTSCEVSRASSLHRLQSKLIPNSQTHIRMRCLQIPQCSITSFVSAEKELAPDRTSTSYHHNIAATWHACHAAPRHVASHRVASRRVASRHVTSRHEESSHVKWHHVTYSQIT